MNGKLMLKRLRVPSVLLAIGVLFGSVFPASATRPDGASAFVPITPCRLVDTRPGPLQTGEVSTLGAEDTVTLAGWGESGNCVLPAGTEGLALNVTALNASAPTFVAVYPAGTTRPVASSLNPAPGAAATPNGVDVALSGEGEFSVFNRAGTVDLVIDVVGYFTDHHHDDRYYRHAQIDNMITELADDVPSHQHDGRYYTEAELLDLVEATKSRVREDVVVEVDNLNAKLDAARKSQHITITKAYVPALTNFHIQKPGGGSGASGSYNYVGARKRGRGLLTVDFTLEFVSDLSAGGSQDYPRSNNQIGLPAGFAASSVVASECKVIAPPGRESGQIGFLTRRGGSAVGMRWMRPDQNTETVRTMDTSASVPIPWEEYATGSGSGQRRLRVECAGVLEARYTG